MSYMARVAATASSGVPPTKRTIAGAAAMAIPPMPMVSVMVESPMSRLASSGPNPGRQRPQQQRGPGPVPVVALVAHLQRLGDQAPEVERLGQPLQGGGQHPGQDVAH